MHHHGSKVVGIQNGQLQMQSNVHFLGNDKIMFL